jgi:type II secretory pathway predicted ATPase ExeA
LGRLGSQGVLAVIGPSGSGKSSLVRAGVVAALRRQGRDVQVVVPGRRPMDALAGVLLAVGRPVLVVDQAEDLFTVCDHPEQRQRFVAEVTEYAEHAPVVIVLRADRTGELSEHPDLARMVERGLFLLGPMTEEALAPPSRAPRARRASSSNQASSTCWCARSRASRVPSRCSATPCARRGYDARGAR